MFTAVMSAAVALSPRPAAVTISDKPVRRDVEAVRERLPLTFEQHRTEEGRTQFVSRTAESTVVLDSDEATLALGDSTLRMRLVGATSSAPADTSPELAGRVNYLIGNDPAKWRTNVATFGTVRFHDVYRGVDLVYYGRGQQLEYDFVVAPGADADRIRLRFDGADDVALDAGGVRVTVGTRSVRMDPPGIYQDTAGGRRTIPGRYVADGPRQVRFEIGAYDHGDALTIDPVISYSTYFGGRGRDAAVAVAVDARGFIYLTGRTGSVNVNTFPLVNPIVSNLTAVDTAFVTKLTPDGSDVVYSTYLGGTFQGAEAHAIAVDRHGRAYIAGTTSAPDFPRVNPVQASCGGSGTDAFVVKLDASGSAFEYATCLGGQSNFEEGLGMTIDEAGNAYVTGSTRSSDFPTKNALQPVRAGRDGEVDAFLSVIRPDGSDFVYSTFLGGTLTDEGFGVAVDERRNVYLTGRTRSTDFPVVNAFQSSLRGRTDAFVTKIDRSGQTIVYSTYLGGAVGVAFGDPTGFRGGDEVGLAIAVDGRGNATVTGKTNSTDLPTLNPAQPVLGGPPKDEGETIASDLFVARFGAAGAAQYVTYAGGNASDSPTAIALDEDGVAWIAGTTESANFPSVRARQRHFGDGLVFSSVDGGANWTAAGGGIGHRHVTSVAVAPANPAVIYAGTWGGGVFKTTNGGRTWAAVNTGITNLLVNAVVVDPYDPSTALAGTDGSGIFKSTDGGATWTQRLGPDLLPVPISKLVISPSNPSIIYAGAAARLFGAVFTSVDGGDTWNLGNFTDLVHALAVDPVTPTTVYAGTPFGIFKSTDGAATFALYRLGEFPAGVTALAVDPVTPSTLYAGGDRGGIFKSADGGVTWTFSSTGFGGTAAALAVHPSNHLTVYAGTNNGVFKTTDGATTWTAATAGLTTPAVTTLSMLPGHPSHLYAGSLGTTDTFVMAIRPNGTIRYSSFLGGNGEDVGGGLAIGERRIYVSGGTASRDFPIVDAVQPAFGGFADAFLTVLSRSEGRRHHR